MVRPALAVLAILFLTGTAQAQGAQDRLCDPGDTDCRQILIDTIRAEVSHANIANRGIDVAFWFMEDSWYADELVRAHQAGVPVRVIVDSRASVEYSRNAGVLDTLRLAGIPMRERFGFGILHWKMMLFSAQNVVQFSGANYSPDAWLPLAEPDYSNYTDEAILFTVKPDIVGSFRRKYDDLWTNIQAYRDYANVTDANRVRVHTGYNDFTFDPELNFPPAEGYAARAIDRYYAEMSRQHPKIDVIMYRITDDRHADAMIEAWRRGVPVRLISEPLQYRSRPEFKYRHIRHSYNMDRLYMAGVPLKQRKHAGLNHQKSVLLYSQNMAIFGSSNWTTSSDLEQEEHNLFTSDGWIFDWFVAQFERKWNNSSGIEETEDFVPRPPDAPVLSLPASGATAVSTTPTLEWHGGPYAHTYDLYLGTTVNPPLFPGASNLPLGPSTSATHQQRYTLPTALAPGTTYYWRVIGRTMANLTATSELRSFTTDSTASPTPGPGDIVLYAADATVIRGSWRREADSSAAGGYAMHHPDAGVSKLASALASPTHYFELPATVEANVEYRLWARIRAQNNAWNNESVFVQFSPGSGSAFPIGTTTGAEINLEDCSGCGVAGWGWQDNAWGIGVEPNPIVFSTSGPVTVRVQTREDGTYIDQIYLRRVSPSVRPGALKNDTTIYPRASGGSTSDTQAPVTSITSPAAGATVSGTVSVTASATDNVGVTSVEILVDGAVAATLTASPYTVSWNTGAVANGSHTLQSRAYDAAGLSGSSALVTVSVNNTSTGPAEIVLYAADATVIQGSWRRVADSTAAGGTAMHHPDAGVGKLTSALASPTHYFELPVTVQAGVGYHLWARIRAQNNAWNNESIFVQFSSGSPFTIGTTSGAEINLEDCNACGVSGWGWQDNAWGVGVQPDPIVFSTGGVKTLRVQTREDGAYIDQIVLSPAAYLTASPGALKNDTTILARSPAADTQAPVTSITSPTAGATVSGTVSVTASATDNVGVTRVEILVDGAVAATLTASPYTFSWNTGTIANGSHTLQSRAYDAAGLSGVSSLISVTVENSTGPREIVLHAADATVIQGSWRREPDATAAGGAALHHPDAGVRKLAAALESPTHYFELTFTPEANVEYRLWARIRAQNDYWANESVFVQFSPGSGSAFPIGTTSGAEVNLEDCSGCGVSGWGWQDNAWGIGVEPSPIVFSTSSPVTLRVQTREDGTFIDQIVLSPVLYRTAAPGPLKNDTTILAKTP